LLRFRSLIFIAVAALVIVPVALLLQGGKHAPERPQTAVSLIAQRVQGLRALHFSTLPKPVQVSGATARREGLADYDRSYPPAARYADETIYRTLGLIGPRVDLRTLSSALYGDGGVAGYYDPRSKRLRIVSGAATGSPVLRDVTIAHELTHALEDQRFGLRLDEGTSDDAALAHLALIEGSATYVMEQYLLRYFSAGQALTGLLGSALAGSPAMPKFLQDQLLFPYVSGMTFVQSLVQEAGGKWTLVDLADRVRPPDSTEQILHPEKYLRVERPLPVTLDVRLPAGWRRAAAGTWGEWQTGELVGAANAAGWGGDRYELWNGPGGAHVLAMSWRWDSGRAARRFALAAGRLRGARMTASGDAVTLVWAPSAELATDAGGRRRSRAGRPSDACC
jgi:hypothetical protein